MMYQTGLVAVIKVNGQVLRENKDFVLLPFGVEYSVLIKNLKAQRVLVSVSIDGTDVLDGQQLMINPNSEVELERFIKNGNLNQGNRLKFIERTSQIEDHRGIKVDDGIVRIEYWTEKVQPYLPVSVTYTFPNWTPGQKPNWNSGYRGVTRESYRSFAPRFSDSVDYGSINSVTCSCSLTDSSAGIPVNANYEEGITVPGSVSNQKFIYVDSFDTEPQSEVIILKLRGNVEGKQVNQPVLVSTKVTCQTCGKVSSSGVRYCPNCGTALHIV